MKREILGYGYKFKFEKIKDVLSNYYGIQTTGLSESSKDALKNIKEDWEANRIPKQSRPRTFRVVIELSE